MLELKFLTEIFRYLPRSGRQTGLVFPSNRTASFSLMSAMSLL